MAGEDLGGIEFEGDLRSRSVYREPDGFIFRFLKGSGLAKTDKAANIICCIIALVAFFIAVRAYMGTDRVVRLKRNGPPSDPALSAEYERLQGYVPGRDTVSE